MKITKDMGREMIEQTKNQGKAAFAYFRTFGAWLLVSGLIGVLGGLIGSLFHECIGWVTILREDYFFLLYLLPFAGVLIVAVYHMLGLKKDRGTNLILSSIRSEEKVPVRMIPSIITGTILTHLCGGSAGREGAALQVGGSIGSNVATVLKRDKKDRRIYTMCGMSAVFSAMFGTPITAAIFSLEVVSIGVIHYSALVPCLIASAIAYGIAQSFGLEAMSYALNVEVSLSLSLCCKVLFFAFVCGIVSIAFCKIMHHAVYLYRNYIKNPYLRIMAGGFLIVGLTLILQTTDYNGAGTHMIEKALYGQVPYTAFFWKIVFTALTIGAGYKGGEIVPTLFIGATLGNVLALLIGMEPGLGAALGMVCMFCSVVNSPIASMMLSLELFGNHEILLFCIACGVSYVFSGYCSLYSSQKIMYSKIQPVFIDRDAQ